MKHLFIVAHPDDEILGCLGTILALKRNREEVYIATASDKSATRENGLREKSKEIHHEINVDGSYYFGWQMMQFDKIDRHEMTVAIETVLEDVKPDAVYIHDGNDIHNDHRVLSQVAIEACKLPLRRSCDWSIKAIYTIEVPSSSDWGSGFIPNSFFEVSEDDLMKKTDLLMMYDDVLRNIPHPRNHTSMKALARYRGGQCGCLYAEAYRKIFEVKCDLFRNTNIS